MAFKYHAKRLLFHSYPNGVDILINLLIPASASRSIAKIVLHEVCI